MCALHSTVAAVDVSRATDRFASAGAFWQAVRSAAAPFSSATLAEVATWVLANRNQPEVKTASEEKTRSVVMLAQ